MAQKVITVNVRGMTKEQPMLEFDIPSLNAALDEGYTVTNVIPVTFTGAATVGFATIIFILDRDDSEPDIYYSEEDESDSGENIG